MRSEAGEAAQALRNSAASRSLVGGAGHSGCDSDSRATIICGDVGDGERDFDTGAGLARLLGDDNEAEAALRLAAAVMAGMRSGRGRSKGASRSTGLVDMPQHSSAARQLHGASKRWCGGDGGGSNEQSIVS